MSKHKRLPGPHPDGADLEQIEKLLLAMEERINTRLDQRLLEMEERINTRFDQRLLEMEERINTRFDLRLREMEERFDQRLRDMEARFDQRFREMEARFDQRLREVEVRFDLRLREVEVRIDQRLQEMEERFDRRLFETENRLEVRFERRLDQRLGELERRLEAFWALQLEQGLRELESRLMAEVAALATRMTVLERDVAQKWAFSKTVALVAFTFLIAWGVYVQNRIDRLTAQVTELSQQMVDLAAGTPASRTKVLLWPTLKPAAISQNLPIANRILADAAGPATSPAYVLAIAERLEMLQRSDPDNAAEAFRVEETLAGYRSRSAAVPPPNARPRPHLKAVVTTTAVSNGEVVGKEQRLDGVTWNHVVFNHVHIVYEGSAIELDHVAFVDCTFTLANTGNGHRFLHAVVRTPQLSLKLPPAI